jgi:hypothetical protein
MQTLKRCPKCGARLIVTAVEDRCPYCGWNKYKALPARERVSSGVDMSLRNQIEDAIAAAPDEYGRQPEHFVSYEPPRENNYERALLCGLMFIFLYICTEFPDFAHHSKGQVISGEFADQFALLAYVIPSVLFLVTTFTTFLVLKPLTIIAGVFSALGGAVVLFDPALSGSLLALPPGWMAYFVGGYLVLSGIWAASIAWRDWQLLRLS